MSSLFINRPPFGEAYSIRRFKITKKCTTCNKVKSTKEFYKRKLSKDGLTPKCKVCHLEDCKKRSDKAPEVARERAREWVKNNPEKASKTRKLYREANPQKTKDDILEWRKRNNDKLIVYRSKRRAKKINAALELYGDIKELNDLVVYEMYSLAKLRTNLRGVEWQVDHIVPLVSDFVCGLHYYNNLRVITAKENHMKSNKHWEGMWQ